MHIQLETPDNNTIQSYTNKQITVGGTVYQHSVMISAESILPEWPVQSVQALNEDNLKPILHLNPDILIIGHQTSDADVPIAVMEYLSQHRVGLECMSIGAASRTFNVLLSEQRKVVLCIIFSD